MPGLVGGVERRAVREDEAEVSFARAVVARIAATKSDDRVIDDFVPDDERALEILVAAGLEHIEVGRVYKLIAGVVGEQRVEIRGAREPMIRGQRADRGCGKGRVRRHAVVDECGEIFPWIVGRRDSRAECGEVGRIDPIADECAVWLRGNDGCVITVAGDIASHGTVIHHRDRRPVCRQLKRGIGRQRLRGVRKDLSVGKRECAGDEIARRDDLVAERDCADALRVAHFCRDGDRLRGERRDRGVSDIADGRADVCSEYGVLRTGRSERVGNVCERGVDGEIEDVVSRDVVLQRAGLRRFRDAVDGDHVVARV